MFTHIIVVGNVAPKLQEAVIGGKRSFDLPNPNSAHVDSQDQYVPTMRGGAPSTRALELPEHEVGQVTLIFKY
jgi:hypothetical protein